MKRLLCIVGSMDAGGAETFLMKMYRQLDKKKYQMDFAVAVETEGFYDQEILSMGGRIFRITPKSKGVFKNFNAIRMLVKEERYQYVLRTSQHSLSALELLAARFGGAKTRVFRSSNSDTTSGSKKQMLLHKLCMFMPECFANVRIAPSTEAAEFMFGKDCIKRGTASLLRNAIDTNVYRFDSQGREQIRAEFRLEDKFVVGHVGRFNQQKNHAFLIDVFQELHHLNPRARLVLVGKGELEEAVRQKVCALGLEEYVIFTGVRQDIPQLLSAFDVFLFPSLYEGMPNTVIEAQATGLPCVISDSITREADITDLVHFCPLDSHISIWVDACAKAGGNNRQWYHDALIEAGYDIRDVGPQFVKWIFEGDT